MKTTILLLHGFKRNGEDDWAQLHDFFSEFEVDHVYNEHWFENHDKETLNLNHFYNRSTEIAMKINADHTDKLIIVSYSAGVTFASNLVEKLNVKEVEFIGVVPTLKIHLVKWLKTLTKMRRANKNLKAKLGKERYHRLIKKQKEERKMEKYPYAIFNFMFFKVISKHGKQLAKIKNAKFLVSRHDHIAKAKHSIKKLEKDNHIIVADFEHDLILKRDKHIFQEWFKSVVSVDYHPRPIEGIDQPD